MQSDFRRIYIAGAHSRATTMGYYLTYLDERTQIVAYLYDNDEDNPNEIDGVPVIKINSDTVLDKNCDVYIAMRGVNRPHILESLHKIGIEKVIPVDVDLDMEIRNEYLKRFYESVGKEFLKIYDFDSDKRDTSCIETATVFVANSIFDKKLEKELSLSVYEKLIQVGTDLSCQRIDKAYAFDNHGENISRLNKQFCELTALYWIWKNAKSDVVGLEHYRRRFILPDNWLERMQVNDIDVILPVPLHVSPSIEGNYRSRHIPSNWDYMICYLKKEYPDDYEDASRFFIETSLYSPCNMFIMKKKVLDELCSWMFPILFAVAEHGGIVDDSYQNRYPGFISERLITYFFEKNRSKYKVVYADKSFIQ